MRVVDCLDGCTLRMKALKSFELFASRCSVTSQKTFQLQQQRRKNLKPRLQIIISEGPEMSVFQYYLWRCWGTPRVHTRHSRSALSATYARLQLKLRTSVLYACKLRSQCRCQLLTSCCVGGRIMSMEHWCYDNDGRKLKYLVTNLHQYHYVQHKYHMDLFGIEPGPPQLQASD